MYCHGKRTQKGSEDLANMYYKNIILDVLSTTTIFFPMFRQSYCAQASSFLSFHDHALTHYVR
jgi:hypothetical protein